MIQADLQIYQRVRYVGPDDMFEEVRTGDIGYIINIFNEDAIEVEFSRKDGTTYAIEVISPRHLKGSEEVVRPSPEQDG